MTHPVDKQERRRTFSGKLNTVEVSSHGCVIHAFRPSPRGTRLRLHILHGNRTTTARVVHSDPIGTGMDLTTWTVALELDKPGNFWMVNSLSPDWPKTSEQQLAGKSSFRFQEGVPIKRTGRDFWLRQ